jgi:hypothetical protein
VIGEVYMMFELLASLSLDPIPPSVIGAVATAGALLLGMLKKMRDEKVKAKPKPAPVADRRR